VPETPIGPEPGRLRTLRERLARHLVTCPCEQPDCPHYPVDRRAWRQADMLVQFVAAWLVDHAMSACRAGSWCGRCSGCGKTVVLRGLFKDLAGEVAALPAGGHPEQLAVGDVDQAVLDALAVTTWSERERQALGRLLGDEEPQP
jgi:hypothetical protein